MLTIFFNGLLTVLTSVIFPLLIIVPFIFERLGKTRKQHNQNLVVFGLLTIVVLVSSSYSLLKMTNLEEFADSDFKGFILIYGVGQMSFFIWFFLTLLPKFSRLYSGIWFKTFSSLGILIFSIKLGLSAISSTGPMMGAMLVAGHNGSSGALQVLYLICFALGLILPFVILLFFLNKKYSILKEKKWWRILQITIGAILLLDAMVKILLTFF